MIELEEQDSEGHRGHSRASSRYDGDYILRDPALQVAMFHRITAEKRPSLTATWSRCQEITCQVTPHIQ